MLKRVVTSIIMAFVVSACGVEDQRKTDLREYSQESNEETKNHESLSFAPGFYNTGACPTYQTMRKILGKHRYKRHRRHIGSKFRVVRNYVIQRSNDSVVNLNRAGSSSLSCAARLQYRLLKLKIRTKAELDNMSLDDQRNTAIVEINNRLGKSIPYLQSKNTKRLAEYLGWR